jgi:hypothetical protein
LYALFSLGEWMWLDWQASGLKTQTVEVFRAAFPQVQTVSIHRCRQQLADQFAQARQLGESNFCPCSLPLRRPWKAAPGIAA